MQNLENNPPPFKRFPELDVIRGIAILCILLLNIRIFALGVYAYASPLNAGAPHFLDRLIFYLVDIFFNGKFISIFCLLFGMTIVILMNHYTEPLRMRSIRRRMIGLCCIGLMHGYLLFSGDILFSYGICGMIAAYCYCFSAKKLVVIGSVLYSIAFLIHVYGFFYAKNIHTNWHVSKTILTTLAHGYLSNFLDQIKMRAPSTFYVQTTLFIKDYFWRTLGLILVGMGIYKQELLFRVQHWVMPMILCVICIGCSSVITLLNIHWQWNAHDTQFLGLPLLYVISFPQAVLYMLLLAVLCRHFSQATIFSFLTAVGKMSLTTYLLESLLANFIFTGSGFGWYGQFSYAQQLIAVIVIWSMILLFAHLWMQRFQRGPIETVLHYLQSTRSSQ